MADITVRFAVKDAQVVRAALESVGKDGEAALQRVNRAFAQMGKSGGSAEQAAAAMAKARQEMEGVGRSGAGLDQAARGFAAFDRQAGMSYAQTQALRAGFVNLFQTIGAGGSPLAAMTTQATQVTGAFLPLGGAALVAAGSVAALLGGTVALAAAAARAGDAQTQLMGRFTALTGSARAAQESYDLLYKSSLVTGAGIRDSADSFTRFSIAAKEIGGTRAEVVQLVDTITKFGVVSGISTQEASAGARQLGQALASGKLQGDELRSILENMPLLAQALAGQLGVGIGELRKMGEEGKLTADVVFPALLRSSQQANEQFAQMPLTMERAGGQLSASWDGFAAKLDKAVGLSERLAKALGYAAGLVDKAGGLVESKSYAQKIEEAQKQLGLLKKSAESSSDVDLATPGSFVGFAPGQQKQNPLSKQIVETEALIERLRALKKEEEALNRESDRTERDDARDRAAANRKKQIESEAKALREDLLPAIKAKAELDKSLAQIAKVELSGGVSAAQAAELRAAAEKKYAEAVDKASGATKAARDAERDRAAALREAANAAESAGKGMAAFLERFDEKPLSEGRKLLVDYDQALERLRSGLSDLMKQYGATSKGHKDYNGLLAAISTTETALAEATGRRAEVAARAAQIDAARLAAAYETVTTLEAEAAATAGGEATLTAYNRTKAEAALRARVFREVLAEETRQLGDVEEATRRANAAADRAVTADRSLQDNRKASAEQQKFAQENARIADRFSDQLADGIMDAFENGGRAGKSMFDTLASLGKQALRAALSTAISEALRAPATDIIGAVRGGLGAGPSSGSSASSGGIGNGTSAGGGLTGGLNSWLFGSAPVYDPGSGLMAIPGTSGALGSGGGLFGNPNLNIGTLGNVAGFGLSAFNFIQKPSLGSGLGMIGSGMGALSALGMIGPAFGPIGMGVSLVASLLGGLGQKTKHPGFGIEINNGTAGLELGKVSGKWMDTSGAKPMGQAAIDAINGVVKSMTGGSVGAGGGGQVYGLSYDGTVKKYRAVGEGLSESTQYDDVAAAISAVTVSALKNLPLQGVAENVATALKKSTADSLEGIKSDIDFAKSWAESMSLLRSGLDPMKSQAAEISKSAKDAAASLQAWGVQFRDKSVALGQGSAEDVNAALRAMVDGALGLTKAAAPLQGYALAWEQAKANIAALKDTLTEFGFTAQETAAKLAAATEAARKQLADDQNSGLSAEILKLKDPKAADLAELEKWKAQAIAEAKAIGNQAGIALIEELFGLKQQAIVEQYKDRIDGLTEAQQRAADAVAQMTADLQSRALAVRQMDRAKALFDFDQNAAKQMASAPAGTEGSLSRVLAGERAMVEFQAYQRDLLEAYDRQIRDVQDQKSAIEAQISAIRAQTQALDGLRQSLEQFQQDLRLDPNLSILSTGQRRDEALSRMDALYAKGMGGDTEALRQWEPLARQFLAISREYNASTPGYVADYNRVQGQLDGALGKIRTPLQVAEAQLATLEAQSKQFDQQIDLLRSQRDQAARYGERQLDSIESLKTGMLESLARLQAAQADLATGFGSLAGVIGGQRAAAAAAANSNVKLGSDGRPVGLLGAGWMSSGRTIRPYSEWSQEKKDAWRTLATNLGISEDLYYRSGADHNSFFSNADGTSKSTYYDPQTGFDAHAGSNMGVVGASGQIYASYAAYRAATDLASNQLGQWLEQQGTTFDEALRRAAQTGVIIGGGGGRHYQAGGIVGAYVDGGIVGNGTWNRDSVLARYAGGGAIALAGGEFVVTAPAVNSNTLPVLEAINSGKRLPSVPLPQVYRPAPAAAGVDSAAIVAAIGQLGEKIDALAEIVAASGDQTAEALAGVRASMGAVALATKQQKLAS